MDELARIMEERGFSAGSSGGGCMWYTRTAPSGSYEAVTDEDGCGLPEGLDDSILVGVYDENGDCRSLDSWATLREWLATEEGGHE